MARRGGGTGRKPPKWEKEGDDLYREIVISSPSSSTADGNRRLSFFQQQMLLGDAITYEQARGLLQNVTSSTTNSAPAASKTKNSVKEIPDDTTNNITEPAFLWGGISVGPVWKSRLLQAGFHQPTPVQKDAFGILAASAPKGKQKQSAAVSTTKKNVIIAAPTGSGKSLAFLLPLITAGTNEKLSGMVWIVTPTNELARQLQGVVLQLMATTSAKKDSSSEEGALELCHVLEMPANAEGNTSDEDESREKISIVSTIGQAPLLVGTPKLFLQLSKELRRDTTPEDPLQQLCGELRDNLHTIVLDEADRLLQTEAVARRDYFRKELKEQNSPVGSKLDAKANAKKLRRLDPTPTELLLHQLLGTRNQATRPNNPYTNANAYQRQQRQLRVICASATVGRTLRRQVMNLVGASSMDQAAVLVTDQIRTKKDAVARKNNLLPETLTHKYYLSNRSQGKDTGSTSVLDELSDMIASLPPAPMLIFPGRTGLRTLQQHLRDNSEISNVRGLEDIQLASTPSLKTEDIETDSLSWSETPIYVVSEKLGRGLDIPDIRYVVLMQVPSSAAGYTHLAGRTGRNGNPGTAISFCAPRQAPKLCIIAETLGISMDELPSNTGDSSSRAALTAEENSLSDSGANSASPITSSEVDNINEDTRGATPTKDNSWSQLSPSALRRKTIAEIKEFMNASGVAYEKSMKKAELLEEVMKILDLP